MGQEITVTGPVLVKLAAASVASGVLQTIGYTMNGITIEENEFTGEVFSDENGGEQGPPIDIQTFGQVDIVTLAFSKYDPVLISYFMGTRAGDTWGTPPQSGALSFQANGSPATSKAIRLLLHAVDAAGSDTFVRNYTRCKIRKPRSFNIGAKHTAISVVVECFRDPNTGKLWNTTKT